MSRLLCRLVPALALVILVAPLCGQSDRPPAAVDLPRLLSNKGVLDELKLSAEQREKIKKLTEERETILKQINRDKENPKLFEKLREISVTIPKVLETTLRPEQLKRLRQIEIWADAGEVGPAGVFRQQRVQKEIKLTDQQKEQLDRAVLELIKKVQNELPKEIQKGSDDLFKAMEKGQALKLESTEKFVATLSEAQQKAWKELAGDKFVLKLEPPRFKKKD